jgi:tripartite-type tricarboxylate transporter receptor subunit TctC
MTDVIGGQVNLAVASISELVVANAQAGKIKILATTHYRPLTINGEVVTPAAKALGVAQFDGGMLLSVTPRTGDAEAARLKADLALVIAGTAVKEKLAKINITVDPKDSAATMRLLTDYRGKVAELK